MNTTDYKRAEAIARQYIGNRLISKELGHGFDGYVFPTSSNSAIKVFESDTRYRKELATYERLREHNVFDVLGFAIPRLLDSDDTLLVIEMTIVHAPFLLDFSHATLDEPFDFTDEALADWWREREELFEDRFPVAQEVFYALQAYGIYYYDLAPRNMDFTNHPRA